MSGPVARVHVVDAPLALYRRYRPETFAEVIGQEHIAEPLRHALANNRFHHAYLFSGPRGCGKTTSARILDEVDRRRGHGEPREMRAMGIEAAYSVVELVGEHAALEDPYASLRQLASRVARTWSF